MGASGRLGSIHRLQRSPRFSWLPEFFQLLQCGWITVAFFQCQFGVDRLKPIRLLGNFEAISSSGVSGPPVMDALERYAGPLPATCPHGGHPPLIKSSHADAFQTTGTGVYPPAMDEALAQVIFQHFSTTCSSRGESNSQEVQEEERVTPGEEGRVTPSTVSRSDSKFGGGVNTHHRNHPSDKGSGMER